MATINDIFEDTLKTMLENLVDGAREDVEQYAHAIAQDAAAVITEPSAAKRLELRSELVGQLRALGEVHRIEASNEAWDAFERILTGTINIGLKALTRGGG